MRLLFGQQRLAQPTAAGMPGAGDAPLGWTGSDGGDGKCKHGSCCVPCLRCGALPQHSWAAARLSGLPPAGAGSLLVLHLALAAALAPLLGILQGQGCARAGGGVRGCTPLPKLGTLHDNSQSRKGGQERMPAVWPCMRAIFTAVLEGPLAL